MPDAKASLSSEFGWSATQIGAVFTALFAAYAVGQFVNGQLGDRFGARIVSTVEVAGSVLMNLLVFFCVTMADSSGSIMKHLLTLLIIFWGINGFFQAMGWSPMVKVMTHWFPIEGRGKAMGWLAHAT